MDDGGNYSLNYFEFKKGINDYGLEMEDDVSLTLLFLFPSLQQVASLKRIRNQLMKLMNIQLATVS